MEKRVTFGGWALPYLLLFPQILVTIVFFFWPAGEAIYQSAFIPDPFGLKSQFVGFGNFEFLFSDPYYLASFKTTVVFSSLVTLVFDGRGTLARGDGRSRTQRGRRLPHAADLALCGRPSRGRGALAFHVQPQCRSGQLVSGPARLSLEPRARSQRGHGAGGGRFVMEPDQLQLPVLSRRTAGHPQKPGGGGGDRWRPLRQAFLDHRLPLAVADHVLPAGGETSSTPSSRPSA